MSDDGFRLTMPETESSWPRLSLGTPTLSLDPSLQPPLPSTTGLPASLGGGQIPPSLLPNIYGHYTDPPLDLSVAPPAAGPPSLSEQLSSFVGNLGTRPGLQVDGGGIGTTVGDWRIRGMPFFGLNAPGAPSPYADTGPPAEPEAMTQRIYGPDGSRL